jgi:predicted phosphodiesterase
MEGMKMSLKDNICILHISDLHFGIEKVKPGLREYRNTVLEKFLSWYGDMVKKNVNEAPEVLVVSGDISFTGAEEDFSEAKVFFEKLLNTKGNKIEPNNIVVCFGNHDMNGERYISYNARSKAFADRFTSCPLDRPAFNIGFDEFVSYDIEVENMFHRFENVERFCDEMKFSKACHRNEDSYKHAYGSCGSVKGIDFVVLNTEWDFWGNADVDAKKGGALRIGAKTYLDAASTAGYNERILVELGTPARFVVYHRPLENLHVHERFVPGSKSADRRTGNLIIQNNDVSLNGHIHVRGVKCVDYTHTIIVAGALYNDNTWDFSCNMITIPKVLEEGRNECELKVFEYDSNLIEWLDDARGKKFQFWIYRYRGAREIKEFIRKFRAWFDSEERRRGQDVEIKKGLIDVYVSLGCREEVFVTLMGKKEFEELKEMLKVKTNFVTLREGLRLMDVSQNSSGGIFVQNEQEKEKLL